MLIVIYGANKLFVAEQTPAPITEVTRNASPGLDGVVAVNVPADQLKVGDCLQGFIGPLEPSTVVTCTTAHNAQLIGTFSMGGDAFPGPADILAQSEELCKSVPLDPASPLDTGWSYHFSRPSKSTWETGDRLVACFLALNEGTVSVSMLPAETPALST